ncbi:hypothetical protein P3T43_006086 [Paraburkholderia sp. GAS41]|jgi:hypothetical protein|uniref:hypothetical protein n=1 Tax=Paraburkholderia sp. GAS41 TaxID=3035134 RepID=UPI003D24ADC7
MLDVKDGPSLILSPDNARALLKAPVPPKDRTANGNDEVVVPTTLEWSGLRNPAAVRGVHRGDLGKVVLSAIRIITAPSVTETEVAHDAVRPSLTGSTLQSATACSALRKIRRKS